MATNVEDIKFKAAFTTHPPNLIRNVCIIAHVDHGKTTLADYLISSNGIISSRLAGKLRYMDSREDEQARGITMKASAISLFYDPLFVNLIDSPGHVDFCAEVNSAINLADVAILVVDVVEGVCPQTETLLRDAVIRQLDIVLVINKLDRLFVELKMSCAEIHRHIQCLVEQLNGCLSQILRAQLAEEESWQRLEEAESQLHFDPIKGNLLFSSAFHGYAFSLKDFSTLWAKKLEVAESALRPHMFSFDHYFQPSTKTISAGAESKGRKTLFEQFVLEPLWQLHKCAFVDVDVERLKMLAGKLGTSVAGSRRWQAAQIDRAFGELMREWMPLTNALIKALCIHGRSPAKTFVDDAADGLKNARERLSRVCGSTSSSVCPFLRQCAPAETLTIVFAAKFFLLNNLRVALCRVMCGTVKEGSELVVIDSKSGELRHTICVSKVYIIMGKELISCGRAPAGQLCALEEDKNTWFGGNVLVSSNYCQKSVSEDDIRRLKFQLSAHEVEPIMRVIVQPASSDSADWNEMRACLKHLAILDSSVRIFEQENGDLALVTAGEVHLQKCLKDLNDLGQTNITVSEPIVPFLETIVPDSSMSSSKIDSEHETQCTLKHFGITIRMRALPLCPELIELIEKSCRVIDRIREDGYDGDDDETARTFRDNLLRIAAECLPKMKGSWWYRRSDVEIRRLFEHVWAFGPPNARGNLLLNGIFERNDLTVFSKQSVMRLLDRSVASGFALAMGHGPLCDEPMHGVCIIVESWNFEDVLTESGKYEEKNDGDENQSTSRDLSSDVQLQGQLISAARQTCAAALRKHSTTMRLVAAMYKCCVQTSLQALGKVQNVLAQRRAKVVSEDVNEVNGLLEVVAHMPVVESFSFCEQLRKRTSGMASAQLTFSHWQLVDEDPFWEPTTEEEIEEYGAGNREALGNQARAYMNAVRKRKGMPTDDVIVVNAEKQRNLSKNK